MAVESQNKRIFYLDELDGLKVHHNDPDVRGWDVYTSDEKKIGEVENLIVDKKDKMVRYLDVHLDDSIIPEGSKPLDTKDSGSAGKVHEHMNEEGQRHMIIPVGLVDIDKGSKNLNMKDYSFDSISGAPRYNRNEGFTRKYEVEVRDKFLPVKYNDKNAPWNKDNNQDLGDDFYVEEYYTYKKS
jgi:sporulation protein YlmC with PRC-barrel domain